MNKENTKPTANKNLIHKTYVLPAETIAKIDVMAERTGKPRSQIIETAIQMYVEDYIRKEQGKR